MAESQRSGCWRNGSGGISTVSLRANTGVRIPPISPMSWYGGSQIAPTLLRSMRKARRMASRLWSRFAWESTTPRGSAVEPEVYWRKAVSSGRAPGSRHAAAAPSASSGPPAPAAIQESFASSGASANIPSASSISAEVVSTAAVRASAAMESSRGSVRVRRAGSGG